MRHALPPEHLHAVSRYLSQQRLAPYVWACAEDLADGLRLYAWNADVGSAFFESLGHLEVVLRNALDQRLIRRHTRTGRSGDWFDDPARELGQRARQDIAAARERVRHKGKAMCHGQVITELPFGFWRYLLARQHQATLWPDLAGAFPHAPDRRLTTVEPPVKRLHVFRNRIAHHEGIWSYPLEDRYADLLLLVGYIDPHIRAWVDRGSRVPSVLAGRPQGGRVE